MEKKREEEIKSIEEKSDTTRVSSAKSPRNSTSFSDKARRSSIFSADRRSTLYDTGSLLNNSFILSLPLPLPAISDISLSLSAQCGSEQQKQQTRMQERRGEID
jgi:hypothetical protein